MAWSITSLANYCESSGPVDPQTTGTLSIPANSVVLVFGHGSQFGGFTWGSNPMSVEDSVDNEVGWTGLDSQVSLGSGANDGGGRVFYKSFTSSTSRTISVLRSDGHTYWGYSVIAITGQDTASPIVQAKGAGTQFGGGDSNSQTVTLNSAPTSGNAVVWFLGVNNDATGAAALPSGYISLANPSTTFEATSAAYHTSTTTAAITSSDVGQSVGYAVAFAVEIRSATPNGVTPSTSWWVA